MRRLLRNEAETLELGAALFRGTKPPLRVDLYGPLGSGKTTLVRGFLRASGYAGPVRSPTFTLVEEYPIANWRLVHFDLYRLADPEELEWIGIRDYFDDECVSFVEWADRGSGFLPEADLSIHLVPKAEERIALLEAGTSEGRRVLATLA